MEDLAEVITAAEFHPTDCSQLVVPTISFGFQSLCFRCTVRPRGQ